MEENEAKKKREKQVEKVGGNGSSMSSRSFMGGYTFLCNSHTLGGPPHKNPRSKSTIKRGGRP
jgi:hypothetical protein